MVKKKSKIDNKKLITRHTQRPFYFSDTSFMNYFGYW